MLVKASCICTRYVLVSSD